MRTPRARTGRSSDALWACGPSGECRVGRLLRGLAALSLGQRVEEAADGDAERMRAKEGNRLSKFGRSPGRARTGLAIGVVYLFCQPVADDGVDSDAEIDLRAERLR